MKKNYIILIVVGFLILITIITNPNIQTHKDAVKRKLNSLIQKSLTANSDKETDMAKLGEGIGVFFGGFIVDKAVETSISSDNYVLFSLTKFNWQGKEKIIGIGILGNVFLSDKISEAFKENPDKETTEINREQLFNNKDEHIKIKPNNEKVKLYGTLRCISNYHSDGYSKEINKDREAPFYVLELSNQITLLEGEMNSEIVNENSIDLYLGDYQNDINEFVDKQVAITCFVGNMNSPYYHRQITATKIFNIQLSN